MAELYGKVAVVMGGRSGMGRATAVIFARVADISGREQDMAEAIGAAAS